MKKRSKRLADLEPGDVIVITKSGKTATVESNQPDSYPPFRARGLYQTQFSMADGRLGGWTGHGSSLIDLVVAG